MKEPCSEFLPNDLTFDQIDKVRILGHNNLPRYVLATVDKYANAQTIKAIFEIIDEINKNIPENEKIKLIVSGDQDATLKDLNLTFNVVDNVLYGFLPDSHDQWLQDFGEIAAVKTKADDGEELMIMDSNRGRGLSAVGPYLKKEFNTYYFKPDPETWDVGNYGGNIEVTPNNILYIGNRSSEKMRQFFSDKGYKDDMVVLDTSWLRVGHVDEFISTIVTPNDECGFAVLKADPLLGLKMIKATHEDKDFLFRKLQIAT